MNLKILLPFGIFAEKKDVLSIVAQTPNGSFGLLPHRLDCVAVLSPSILSYTTAVGETLMAIDEGILIKTGADVFVSVRRAIDGADLGQLRNAVENEFLKLDEQQKNVRLVLAKLESGFLAHFVKLNHA